MRDSMGAAGRREAPGLEDSRVPAKPINTNARLTTAAPSPSG